MPWKRATRIGRRHWGSARTLAEPGRPEISAQGLLLPRHAKGLHSEPVLNLHPGRDAHLHHAFLQKREGVGPTAISQPCSQTSPAPAHWPVMLG